MSWKTYAIDEESVERSDYTWEEMYYKQLRVPGYLLALLVLAVYLQGVGWWVLGGVPLLAYSFWPAIGARHYAVGEQ